MSTFEQSTLVKSLRENRARTYEQAKSLADAAANENRAFDASEEATWHQLNRNIDALDKRIGDLKKTEDSRAASEANLIAAQGGPRPPQVDNELNERFRRAVLENDPRPIDVMPTQRRSGYQPGLERRDLVTTGPANMTPISFHDQLVMHLVEESGVLAAGATLLNTDSGEGLRIPRSTAHSTAIIFNEAATITESDPTLSSHELGAFKYGVRVQVSSELAADAGFDLAGYLAKETGIALGLGLGEHLISGNGTTEPSGLYADATAGVTGAVGTGGGFGDQDAAGQGGDLLIDLFASLAAPYARSQAAAWLMNTQTLAEVRKLKDTNGNYVFSVDVPQGSGAVGTLLGRPVHIDPFVASTTTGSTSSVVFGDFSRYMVRIAGGIRFERSNEFAWDKDLIDFRALMRADGVLADVSALKLFVGSAT